MHGNLRKTLSLVLSFCFLFQQASFAQVAAELNLGSYFSKVGSSLTQEKFRPLHLRYFSYDNASDNFKVLLDKGSLKEVADAQAKAATQDLLSYFLVGVSLPDSLFWVNLRPDAQDQVIDPLLEKTEIGKIMLEADLQLKKDTAALTSPRTTEGKAYWAKLYKKAAELYGNDNTSIPTLTRPWIVPGEVIVRETKDSAYVYKAGLKVMLEQDYLKDSSVYNFPDARSKALNEYSSQLIRELIIPKLTRDVNSAKRYSALRQVYYSLILSRWFKMRFTGKEGTYSKLINTANLSNLTSAQSWSKSTYFNAYKKSFADGEYNISEPVSTPTGQVIRTYFSGGIQIGVGAIKTDGFGTATARIVPGMGIIQEGNAKTGAASPLSVNWDIAVTNINLPEMFRNSARDIENLVVQGVGKLLKDGQNTGSTGFLGSIGKYEFHGGFLILWKQGHPVVTGHVSESKTAYKWQVNLEIKKKLPVNSSVSPVQDRNKLFDDLVAVINELRQLEDQGASIHFEDPQEGFDYQGDIVLTGPYFNDAWTNRLHELVASARGLGINADHIAITYSFVLDQQAYRELRNRIKPTETELAQGAASPVSIGDKLVWDSVIWSDPNEVSVPLNAEVKDALERQSQELLHAFKVGKLNDKQTYVLSVPNQKGIRYTLGLEIQDGVIKESAIYGIYSAIRNPVHKGDELGLVILEPIKSGSVAGQAASSPLQLDYAKLRASVAQALQNLPEDEQDQNLKFFAAVDKLGKMLYPLNQNDTFMIGHIRGDRASYFARGLQNRGFKKLLGYIKFSADFVGQFILPETIIGKIKGTFFEILSNQGYKVLKVSEDEKAPHVGGNANGRQEEVYPGETRVSIAMQKSKKSYVDTPWMKIKECGDEVLKGLDDETIDFILFNLLSSDMMKHTGNFEAAVIGNQLTDEQLGRMKEKIDAIRTKILSEMAGEIIRTERRVSLRTKFLSLLSTDYDALLKELYKINPFLLQRIKALEAKIPLLVVTADHGASEDGLKGIKQADGSIKSDPKNSDTFHTANPVPYIIYDALRNKKIDLKTGMTIANNAATLLQLLGEKIPEGYDESMLPAEYQGMKRRIAFGVLDGWGINPNQNYEFDAIRLAHTPNYDWFVKNASFTQIEARGDVIGLRDILTYEVGPHHLTGKQAGQTDIGHLTMFRGKKEKQPLVYVDELIKGGLQNGVFDESKPEVQVMVQALQQVKDTDTKFHYMLIASEGGVHSSLYHMYAVMRLAKKMGLREDQFVIHLAADGRDVPVRLAHYYIDDVLKRIQDIGIGVISVEFGRDMLVRKKGSEDITNRIIDVMTGENLEAEDVTEYEVAASPLSAVENLSGEIAEMVLNAHPNSFPELDRELLRDNLASLFSRKSPGGWMEESLTYQETFTDFAGYPAQPHEIRIAWDKIVNDYMLTVSVTNQVTKSSAILDVFSFQIEGLEAKFAILAEAKKNSPPTSISSQAASSALKSHSPWEKMNYSDRLNRVGMLVGDKNYSPVEFTRPGQRYTEKGLCRVSALEPSKISRNNWDITLALRQDGGQEEAFNILFTSIHSLGDFVVSLAKIEQLEREFTQAFNMEKAYLQASNGTNPAAVAAAREKRIALRRQINGLMSGSAGSPLTSVAARKLLANEVLLSGAAKLVALCSTWDSQTSDSVLISLAEKAPRWLNEGYRDIENVLRGASLSEKERQEITLDLQKNIARAEQKFSRYSPRDQVTYDLLIQSVADSLTGFLNKLRIVSGVNAINNQQLLFDTAIGKEREKAATWNIFSSSPLSSGEQKTGGIDFRAIKASFQPIGSFKNLKLELPHLSQAALEKINPEAEMQQVRNMVERGIAPSGTRIKELIAACAQKGELDAYSDSLLLCLADICKLQEESASETSVELKEALVLLDVRG